MKVVFLELAQNVFLSVANVFDRKIILLKTCLIGTLQLTLIVSRNVFGDRFMAIVCNPPIMTAMPSAGSGGFLYDFVILLSLCPIGRNLKNEM